MPRNWFVENCYKNNSEEICFLKKVNRCQKSVWAAEKQPLARFPKTWKVLMKGCLRKLNVCARFCLPKTNFDFLANWTKLSQSTLFLKLLWNSGMVAGLKIGEGGSSLPCSNVMSIIYPLWLRWWQSLTENFHLGKHDVFYYLVFVKIFSTSLYIRFWCFY